MSDVFSTGVPGGCHGEEHEVRSGAGIIWSKAGWFRSFELISATTGTRQLARLHCHHQSLLNWPERIYDWPGHISICPPEPKRRPQVARLRPQYPRTQTEVVACQATVSMPPEPKRGPQLARLRPRCPQDPNGGRGLPGHELNAPGTQTEIGQNDPNLELNIAETMLVGNRKPNAISRAGNGETNDVPNLELNIAG
ncbi:hypothetical protein B0H14DRAFT_2611924 [Mycena olivaceomarginata]|nr:hypothetical protein B0H14DRAFT_2611924 [Mycena olivaceomarginata]